MAIQGLNKYTLLTEDFFDDEENNDVAIQDDEVSDSEQVHGSFKYKMCIDLGFNNFYVVNASDLDDLKKQIIRVIKRINSLFEIYPCITSYEIEDTNIENVESKDIDYHDHYGIFIHFNTKTRKSIIPFIKFLNTLSNLTANLSGPKINILDIYIENESNEFSWNLKVNANDFDKRLTWKHKEPNDKLIRVLELISNIKRGDFYDECNEYFGIDNVVPLIYATINRAGNANYIEDCGAYELTDYSTISKFCNTFIDIATNDRRNHNYLFDSLLFHGSQSVKLDYVSYEGKIKMIQQILSIYSSDKLKAKITFMSNELMYKELHMYLTFNKSYKITDCRYYIAPRLFIKENSEIDEIVNFFKPLFDIGWTDEDCYMVVSGSKILSARKYTDKRKQVQTALKEYYESH